MKAHLKKLNKITITSLLSILSFQYLPLLASEVLVAENNSDTIEELKVKKVRKNGKLVVKFCNKLSDLSGYVEVQNKKFFVNDASLVKGKKLVWKNTNLSPTKNGDTIKTAHLLSADKVIVDGNCDGLGILPFILIGAGIAAGSGSGGSGSSSSN